MTVIFVCTVAIIAASIPFYLFFFGKKLPDVFVDQVSEWNKQHGLNFNPDVILGSRGVGLLFDRTNRKLLLVERKNFEILGYDYVTRWNHHWTERRNGITDNERIVIDTRDFDRPQLAFRVASHAAGEAWKARLDIIFNQE